MEPMQLTTERLAIRELGGEDLDFVASMLGDSEVMAYWPRTYSRSEAEDWIANQQARYRRDGYGYWILNRRETGEPVGQAGLLRQEFEGRVEVGLGYILHRPFWGQGFALEAARRCLQHGFLTLGLAQIVVLIRPENERSVHLAEKLGAQLEGETIYAGFVHRIYTVHPE